MRLFICILASGFLLTGCHRDNVSGVEVDSRLKGYILPSSKVLAGVSLEKIKQTDFYKRHAAQLTFPQLNQLPEQIGMDPRRDLSSFLLSWDGTETLVMTHGTFEPEQIEKRLNANATPSEKYNKFTLYGDRNRDVVLLPKSVALAGSPVVLKKALDEDATGAGGLTEDLQLQLARMNGGAQIWLVSTGVIPLEQLSMRSDAATTLSNISDYINATATGVTFGSGLALDAHISCISEEGSQRVNDALRGVIGLARLSTQDNQPDQLRMWDSIHVQKQGKEVRITAELPAPLADKLLSTLPSLTNRF